VNVRPEETTRRIFLAGTGTGIAALLAGCSGDDSEGPEPTETETPGETPTETQTRTPEEPPENYIIHVLSEGGDRDSNAVRREPEEDFRRYEVNFSELEQLKQEERENVFEETETDWQEFLDTVMDPNAYPEVKQENWNRNVGYTNQRDQFEPGIFASQESVRDALDEGHGQVFAWNALGKDQQPPEGADTDNVWNEKAVPRPGDSWKFAPILQEMINRHNENADSFFWPIEIYEVQEDGRYNMFVERDDDNRYRMMAGIDLTKNDLVVADSLHMPEDLFQESLHDIAENREDIDDRHPYLDFLDLRLDKPDLDFLTNTILYNILLEEPIHENGTFETTHEVEGKNFRSELRTLHDVSRFSLYFPDFGKDIESHLENLEEEAYEKCVSDGSSEDFCENRAERVWNYEFDPHNAIKANFYWMPLRYDGSEPEVEGLDYETATHLLGRTFRHMVASPESGNIENVIGEDAGVGMTQEYRKSMAQELRDPGSQLGEESFQEMYDQAMVLHQLAEDDGNYVIAGDVRRPTYGRIGSEEDSEVVEQLWRDKEGEMDNLRETLLN